MPYFELNTVDYSELSYNRITYIITDIRRNGADLQEEIRQIWMRFKNVVEKDFIFGYVNHIDNININTTIAVNINNEYHQEMAKDSADESHMT